MKEIVNFQEPVILHLSRLLIIPQTFESPPRSSSSNTGHEVLEIAHQPRPYKSCDDAALWSA
jgi:hypothetical protein